VTKPSPRTPPPAAADESPFEEARRLAAKLHRPVYLVDGKPTTEKPSKPATTVWPSGTVTMGNPDAAARDIERKLVPRRPAA